MRTDLGELHFDRYGHLAESEGGTALATRTCEKCQENQRDYGHDFPCPGCPFATEWEIGRYEPPDLNDLLLLARFRRLWSLVVKVEWGTRPDKTRVRLFSLDFPTLHHIRAYPGAYVSFTDRDERILNLAVQKLQEWAVL